MIGLGSVPCFLLPRDPMRMTGRAVLATGLAIVAAMACDPPQEPAVPESIVTDSAGIRIVHNAGGRTSLQVRELVRFGQVDGDPSYVFHQVRGITVGGDGTLWVSDSNASIRRYTTEGVYVGAAGGSGAGPGESTGGYGRVWASDSTVYAISYSSGTFQLFANSGAFLGSRAAYADDRLPLVPVGPSTNAWWFLHVGFPNGRARGRETWTVYLGPATDEELERVAIFEGSPFVAAGPGRWRGGSFFDGYPSLSTSPGGRLYYTHPTDYQIEVVSEDGSLTDLFRRSVPRRPYRGGFRREIERGIRTAYRSLSSQVDEEQVEAMLESALPVSDPEWLPVIDGILVDRSGSFWVRRADAHPRPAMRAVASAFGYVPWAWPEEWKAPWAFDLFTSDGRYRGSVTLPLEFVPMAVSDTWVYGVYRDEFDVEYVAIWEALDSSESSETVSGPGN